MKKLIIIAILLLTRSTYADAIPGEFEFDASLAHYNNAFNYDIYNITTVFAKYGVSHDWFQPYVFGEQQIYSQAGDSLISNYPFMDIYEYGIGITFKKSSTFKQVTFVDITC